MADNSEKIRQIKEQVDLVDQERAVPIPIGLSPALQLIADYLATETGDGMTESDVRSIVEAEVDVLEAALLEADDQIKASLAQKIAELETRIGGGGNSDESVIRALVAAAIATLKGEVQGNIDGLWQDKADRTQVDNLFANKADKAQVDELFANKADKAQVDELFAIKADKAQVDELFANKADKTQTDDLFANKADKTQIDDLFANKADKAQIDDLFANKADKAQTDALFANKADKTQVDELFANKADKAQIDDLFANKADKAQVDELFATKADKAQVDELFATKADKTELEALREKDRELEAKIGTGGGGGVSEALVRQLIAEKIEVIEAAIRALQETDGRDDTRHALLLELIEALRNNDTADDARHAAVLAKIAELETRIREGGGVTMSEVQTLIDALRAEVKTADDALRAADIADNERHATVLAKIAELETRIREGGGVTISEVQALMDALRAEVKTADDALQAADIADNERHAAVLAKIAELETRIREGSGVTMPEIQALIDALRAEMKTADDALRAADNERHAIVLAKIAELETRIREGGGVTISEVQVLINTLRAEVKTADDALRAADIADNERHAIVLAKIAELETRIREGGGVTISEVQALIDALRAEVRTADDTLRAGDSAMASQLAELRNAITALQTAGIADNTRHAAILAKITEIEARLQEGGGIKKSEVEALLDAALLVLRSEIKAADDALRATDGTMAAQLAELRNAITALQAADTADHERHATVLQRIAELQEQIRNNKGISAEEARQMIVQALTLLQLDDRLAALLRKIEALPTGVGQEEAQRMIQEALSLLRFEERHTLITQRITTLEQQILRPDGITADQARKMIIDALSMLKVDERHAEALQKIVDLKTEIDGRGYTSQTVVKTLIELEVAALRLEIQQLKGTDTELRGLCEALDTRLDTLTERVEGLTNKAIGSDYFNTEIARIISTHLTGVLERLSKLEGRDTADDTRHQKLEDDLRRLREEFIGKDHNSPGARLARICHQGHGIVAGLEVGINKIHYISVENGHAIAPSGRLLIAPTKHTFTHCKPYDNSITKYDFFKRPTTPGVPESQYEVWTLLEGSKYLPPNDLPANARGLTPANAAEVAEPFIADKIVLLWYQDDQPHQYLLMRREDVLEKLKLNRIYLPGERRNADYLNNEPYSREDDIQTDDDLFRAIHPATKLPEIPLFRFGFFTAEDCSPEELDETEFPELKSVDDFYNTWVPIIDDAITRLEEAIHMTKHYYQPVLFPMLSKNHFDPKMEQLPDKWTRFKSFNSGKAPAQLTFRSRAAASDTRESDKSTKHFTQYFYGWVRDLIASYHELRDLLIELVADIQALTAENLDTRYNHLLLGPAWQPEPGGIDAPLRNALVQPPIYNGNADRLETARLYYRRFFKMIDGFYIDQFSPDDVKPGWLVPEDDTDKVADAAPSFDKIRITPGKSLRHPLSEQTIPYYYPLNDNPESLQHYWNYRRAKSRTADRNLSYHATDREDYASYSIHRDIVRPLYYDLSGCDFYRVEGHVGKDKTEVETEFKCLKRKYNLDFEVITKTVTEMASAVETDDCPKPFNTLSIPGAEHIGGVVKGGTLVLVSDGTIVVGDFSVPYYVFSM